MRHLQDVTEGCIMVLCMKALVQIVQVRRHAVQYSSHLCFALACHLIQVKAGVPICCINLAQHLQQ